MNKDSKTFFRVFLIFIGSIILSWPARIFFADLYIAIVKPVSNPGSLLPYLPGHHFEGYLIAYVFLISLFTFLSIEKDIQRWVWLLLIGPLLALTIGLWDMYLWFAAATILSFALAKLAHFAIKKFKST